MKITVSNIACKNIEFEEALKVLSCQSIHGLDIAPKLIWPDPITATKDQRRDFQKKVEQYNLSIVGVHGLLYNCPELQLFGTPSQRQRCLEYLKDVIELCRDIGGKNLAFGAHKNRNKGPLEINEALHVAVPFFRKLAKTAEDFGVYFCFEPLSTFYGCDFINTVEEGADLVKHVDHPHFKLLLDTGSCFLNKESPCQLIEMYRNIIEHIHINDPDLFPPGAGGYDHKKIAQTLKQVGYDKCLAMEFLPRAPTLEEDMDYALQCYGHLKSNAFVK